MLVSLLASNVALAQSRTGRITGTLTDAQSTPLPAVAVIARGVDSERTAVTDSTGGFVFEMLEPGAYAVVGDAPGFEGIPVRITLAANAVRVVPLRMLVFPLEEIDFFTNFTDYYRVARVAAHLRIERTQEPQPCDESLRPHHVARVVRTIKGTLPPTIWLEQLNARRCLSKRGQLVEDSDVYDAGSEFLALADRDADSDNYVVGPFMLPLLRGRLSAFRPVPAPLRAGMTVEEAIAALAALPER